MAKRGWIKSAIYCIFFILLFGCKKEDTINPHLKMAQVDSFMEKLSSSNRFLIVPMRNFEKTTSPDKVVIAFRHDMDDDMAACLEMAKIEHKYNIVASYYLLHTASYYGITKLNYFKRNNNVINDLKKIQNEYGHEMGWHNDLVTLQVVYNIMPKQYLTDELSYLKKNGIYIYGTVAHGSPYCYAFHYTNNYFWEGYTAKSDDYFNNWEFVTKDNENIKLEKAKITDFMEYDGNLFKSDYFFHDVSRKDGNRWNVRDVNFDTIQPGKKVIILLHPQHWYP